MLCQVPAGRTEKSDQGHSAWEAQNGRAERESTQKKILVRVGTGVEREQGIPKIPSTQTTEASQKWTPGRDLLRGNKNRRVRAALDRTTAETADRENRPRENWRQQRRKSSGKNRGTRTEQHPVNISTWGRLYSRRESFSEIWCR
jgi:hypothetical protein